MAQIRRLGAFAWLAVVTLTSEGARHKAEREATTAGECVTPDRAVGPAPHLGDGGAASAGHAIG
jgi:hypothetical protein